MDDPLVWRLPDNHGINQRDMFKLYEPPPNESNIRPRMVPELVYRAANMQLRGEMSIRLVALLPGRHGEIHLDVYAVPSVMRADYEALSYVWGKPADGAYTVNLNGHSDIAVTYNLFNALHRLRHRYSKRILWIDQLCINQNDQAEKEVQVAMMAEIYRQAACVNVWLGESMTATNELIAWRLEARGIRDRILKAKGNMRDSKRGRYYDKYSDDRKFERILQKSYEKAWEVNKKIEQYQNETRIDFEDSVAKWYTRMWTVQEFALARKAFICWGQARVLYNQSEVSTRDESDVERLLQRMYRISTRISGNALVDPERTLLTVYPVVRPEQDIRYSSLGSLRDSVTVDCQNGRDYIYGLLGLLHPREAQLIGVDYNLTQAQLSAKATYMTMKYSRKMTGLVANWHSPYSPGAPVRLGPREPDPYWSELPSWSLNLTCSRGRLGMCSNYEEERDPWRWDDVKPDLEISIADSDMTVDSTWRLLSISGFALDTILVPSLRLDDPPASSARTDNSLPCLMDSVECGELDIDARPFCSIDTRVKAITKKALEDPRSRYTTGPDRKTLAEMRSESMPDFEADASLLEQNFADSNRIRLDAGDLNSADLGQSTANPGYLLNFDRHEYGYNCFVTRSGLMGFSRQPMEQGDVLLYVEGSQLLLVLRSSESRNHRRLYSFHGMAYVPGVPPKKLVPRRQRKAEREKQTFILC